MALKFLYQMNKIWEKGKKKITWINVHVDPTCYLRNDMKKTELQTSDTDQFSNSNNSINILIFMYQLMY